MNKRIQQLAEQALQLVADEHANGDESRLNLASYTVKDLVQEKFAELIVRECMSVADLPNNASGQWDHLLSSEVIGKHFGVAE